MGRRDRQMALLRVLAAAAWADGRLDNEEINHLKELMLAYKLSEAEMGEIERLLAAPVSYPRCEELTRELMGMLSTAGEREEVLSEVEAILRADGTLSDDEAEVLDGLRGVMQAMSTADAFMGKVTGVFRRMFAARNTAADPGAVSAFLKNAVLQRLHDVSAGAWARETDAETLNRYTLFGAVLGRVAQAEDGVSDEELARIERLLADRFKLAPPLLDWVVQSVREAAAQDVDRQGLLSEFNRISDSDERKELLDAAFAVAAADGEVGKGELEELRLISNFLWIDPRDFHAVRARWAE